MRSRAGLVVALLVLLLSGLAASEGRAAASDGQITWAVHTTLVPTYFDPAETDHDSARLGASASDRATSRTAASAARVTARAGGR